MKTIVQAVKEWEAEAALMPYESDPHLEIRAYLNGQVTIVPQSRC